MDAHTSRPRFRLAALLLAAALVGPGCLFMTPHGEPVLVERTTQSDVWDGNGMLVERTADGRMCKVQLRDEIGIVVTRWFDCQVVHRRLN